MTTKKDILKLKLTKGLLYKSKSISDLRKYADISMPTCLQTVNNMLNTGIIVKDGFGPSIGGRKPDLYKLAPESFFVLCIEIERYQTKIALLDNLLNYKIPLNAFKINLENDANYCDLLFRLISNATKQIDLKNLKLAGISIIIPGLVSNQKNNNHTFIITNSHLNGLKQLLEKEFKTIVYVQNDVKCYAAAEIHLGNAKDKKDVLVLLMDWGIGLGIIMDGKVRGGTSGFSGEIGHMPFIDNGTLCYCGKRGCLETVASGIALAKMAKQGISSGQHSLLNQLSESELSKIEPNLIINAANRGDQYAIKILADIGTMMGKGLAMAIQLFNPELIILGGKMAEANQYITIPMQQAINTYSMTQIREAVTIQTSEIGNDATILGAATNVFSYYLDKLISN